MFISSIGISSVQEYYNSVCYNWMSNNPGRTSTMHNNTEILGHTFPEVMTPINIQFRVAGLVPVNRGVFEIIISCQQRQEIVVKQ